MPTDNLPTKKTEDLPSLSSDRAKPLADWLFKHGRCAWQVQATKKNPRAIEAWIVNGRIVIVTIAEHGWDLYTQPDTNDIAATLADAELRVGMRAAPVKES